MALEISIRELSAESAVVVFEGNLTLGLSLNVVEAQLRDLIESGTSKLILDLTAVPYCDSAGLGILVQTYSLADQKGGMVRLTGLSQRLEGVLKMTAADRFLHVDSDLAASQAALG